MAQSVPLSAIYEVVCRNLDSEGQPIKGALMRSDFAIEIQAALEAWYKHIDAEVEKLNEVQSTANTDSVR